MTQYPSTGNKLVQAMLAITITMAILYLSMTSRNSPEIITPTTTVLDQAPLPPSTRGTPTQVPLMMVLMTIIRPLQDLLLVILAMTTRLLRDLHLRMM